MTHYTPTELVGLLLTNGFNVGVGVVDIVDRDYVGVDYSFVTGDFTKALWSAKRFFGIYGWEAESFDCDDFARAAAALAQYLHHKTAGRPKDTALAFGELWYRKDNGEGHAINIFVDAGNVFKFEPQTASFVELSAAEKLNTFKVRF